MSTQSDATAISVPRDNIDKIIMSKVHTQPVSDFVGAQGFLFTGSPYLTLLTAVYSYDNGTTWRDCKSLYLGGAATSRPPVLVQLENLPSSDQVSMSVYQDALINGGVGYNITVKCAFAAVPELTTVDTSSLEFSAPTAYNTGEQYLKLNKQGSFNVVGAVTSNTTIPHTVGDIPYCQVFEYDPAFSNAPINSLFMNAPNPTVGVTLTSTDIKVYYQTSGSATFYYRIYEEA